MSRTEIPEAVLRFIERRIDSVPHLEALLLLWENQARSWTSAEIGARVYIGADHAHRVLTDLARNGFIVVAPETPDRYVYSAAWDESQLLEKVAMAYRQHLVRLSELIHTKAASAAVRDFARAFKFKSGE